MKNLQVLKNADILSCNADELVDLKSVEINRKIPLNRRASDFIAQVGNPYLFKVGETVVKIEFCDGKDFSEMLTDFISTG